MTLAFDRDASILRAYRMAIEAKQYAIADVLEDVILDRRSIHGITKETPAPNVIESIPPSITVGSRLNTCGQVNSKQVTSNVENVIAAGNILGRADER